MTKGERVFPHPVARTDAEIWLEMKKAHFNPLWSSSVIDSPHLTPEDRRQTFFSKMHRRYGEYDYFEFHYDVENIRIAKSEQRDLLQDLRDVADGLEVVHEEMRPAPELGKEIDAFQSQLLALPEFKTLWAMERMCRLYAQPTNEPTEFNLYAETAHFHIWLRLITRERDYNLYTYFFAK